MVAFEVGDLLLTLVFILLIGHLVLTVYYIEYASKPSAMVGESQSSNIHIVSYNGSLVQCINLTRGELCYIEVLRDDNIEYAGG